MAFAYTVASADDIGHWFALFESFVTQIGWKVEAGSGSTSMIIRSPGEAGGYTKLWAHVLAVEGVICFRVQDDLAATHKSRHHAEMTPVPGRFDFWMNGDLEFINICVKNRAEPDRWDYAGFGCVADFTALAPDETFKMAVTQRGKQAVEVDWLNEAWEADLVRFDDPDAISLEPDKMTFTDMPIERDSQVIARIPHLSRQHIPIRDREYAVLRYATGPREMWILRTV